MSFDIDIREIITIYERLNWVKNQHLKKLKTSSREP